MKKIFILLIILLSSCTKKEEGIKLEILSKKLISNKNLDSLRYSSNIDFDKNLNQNIFRFKLTNLTNQNKLLAITNLFYNGINTIEGTNFDLNFLQIIQTEIKDTVKIFRAHTLPMASNEENDLFKKNSKIKIQQFNNLNYFKPLDWIQLNEQITNNLIYLKPKEIKYFEVFINLPYSENTSGVSYVNLNYKNKYIAYLKLTSNTVNIKKYLTWSQLKYIEDNNYKFYNGTIFSENSVPIQFVE